MAEGERDGGRLRQLRDDHQNAPLATHRARLSRVAALPLPRTVFSENPLSGRDESAIRTRRPHARIVFFSSSFVEPRGALETLFSLFLEVSRPTVANKDFHLFPT